MVTAVAYKHGNFDDLASDYARHRPGYSEAIALAILSLTEVSPMMLILRISVPERAFGPV